jgi:hypothetical protein
MNHLSEPHKEPVRSQRKLPSLADSDLFLKASVVCTTRVIHGTSIGPKAGTHSHREVWPVNSLCSGGPVSAFVFLWVGKSFRFLHRSLSCCLGGPVLVLSGPVLALGVEALFGCAKAVRHSPTRDCVQEKTQGSNKRSYNRVTPQTWLPQESARRTIVGSTRIKHNRSQKRTEV